MSDNFILYAGAVLILAIIALYELARFRERKIEQMRADYQGANDHAQDQAFDSQLADQQAQEGAANAKRVEATDTYQRFIDEHSGEWRPGNK